jgi:hypothetical protein
MDVFWAFTGIGLLAFLCLAGFGLMVRLANGNRRKQ